MRQKCDLDTWLTIFQQYQHKMHAKHNRDRQETVNEEARRKKNINMTHTSLKLTVNDDFDLMSSETFFSVIASTSYKRIFSDTPSIKNGQDNAKLLREALVKAGKTFDHHTYDGVGYDSFFSLTHHNEIWIQAAWQHQLNLIKCTSHNHCSKSIFIL